MSTKMQNMVEGFALCGDGTDIFDIALIKKTHPEWVAGKYNGIGGRVEGDENPIEAMCREFYEEAGVIVSEKRWSNFLTLVGKWGVVHFFVAKFPRNLFNQIHTTTEEEVAIFTTLTLPPNMIRNLSWIIPLALDPDVRRPILITEDLE